MKNNLKVCWAALGILLSSTVFTQNEKKFFLLDTKLEMKDSTVVFESFDSNRAYDKAKFNCQFKYREKTPSLTDGMCLYFKQYGDIDARSFMNEFDNVSYKMMGKKGVIDTLNTLTGNSNLYIQPSLVKRYEAWVKGSDVIIKMKIRFDILNIYKEKISSVEFEEATEWIDYTKMSMNPKKMMGAASSAQEKQKSELIRIQEKLLEDFLTSSQFSEAKKLKLFSEENMLTEPLTLSSNKSTSGKMSDFAKSVVTIKVDDGHGSGCVVSKDGYILTNYHVIAGSKQIKIFNNTITECTAKVIKVSKLNDLALLKIEGNNLSTLSFSTEEPDFGAEIYAIGTPADIQLGQTLTKGIISGKRKFDDRECYQTDVKINPGSSGGAIIDKSGNLVAIVSSKLVGRGIEGIGFGIPLSQAISTFKLTVN